MKQTDTITNFDPEKFLVVAEKRFDYSQSANISSRSRAAGAD